MKKTIISLKHRDLVLYLNTQEANNLLDQFYDLCAGELSDNCLEVVSQFEGVNETVLIRADEVLSVRCSDFQE